MDWLEARANEIRQLITSRDEGSHWSLFFSHPEGAPVVASVVADAMAEMDGELLNAIVKIINTVPSPAFMIAVIRGDGRPRPEDRQMWADLLSRMRGSDRIALGLLVVGTSTHCYVGEAGLGTAARPVA